jgi:hypothetical protein
LRIPYYYSEENNRFIKHPLHYTLFSQFKWYRKFTQYEFGWEWAEHTFDQGEYKCWCRMKDAQL